MDGIGALEPTDTKRRLRNDFEDREFRIIAVAFGSKRVRIEEFVDRKRAFTDEASHELHTPLSVVPSAVQSLPEVSTVNGGIAISKAAVSGSAFVWSSASALDSARIDVQSAPGAGARFDVTSAPAY